MPEYVAERATPANPAAAMAVSCSAEPSAASTAKVTQVIRCVPGGFATMPKRPAATISWVTTIQARRRPMRASSGTGMLSTTAPRMNLKV